jgi:hypothetical protein
VANTGVPELRGSGDGSGTWLLAPAGSVHQWLTDWIEDLGRERSDSTAMSTSRIVGHPEEGQVEREALSHFPRQCEDLVEDACPGSYTVGREIESGRAITQLFPPTINRAGPHFDAS